MMHEIKLAHKTIGGGHPVFIIGEIGINHNGCIDTAKKLIDAAKDAGCSAVKLQKRELEEIYTHDVLHNLKNFEQGFQYLIPILKDYEFSQTQLQELKDYCDAQGMMLICTPFDPVSAQNIHDMGVELFKVSSADLTNFYLLSTLVKFKKPLILSTGMSSYEEIDKTVAFLKKHNAEFCLLHCVSSYPVNYTDANLKRIEHLRERYQTLVGYSGHDDGISLSIAAVTLGAVIVEKHITLDKSMRGPDHKFSLLPEDLNMLVSEIRHVESALQTSKDYILQGEMLNKMVFRKSLVANTDIKQGTKITEDMLSAKSPDHGLNVQAYFDVVGSIAKRDIKKDQLFIDSDLSEASGSDLVTKVSWAQQGYVVRYHDFESVLAFSPSCLEFHFTYGDTTLDIPHGKFKKYASLLKDITLRIHCCEYVGEELFDICHKTATRRKRARETLQKIIDITAEIAPYFNGDTPRIVFNCGAMTRHDRPNSVKISQDLIHEEFKQLDLRGIGLMAQNMPPYPWYFGGQWRGHYFLEAQELIDFHQATGEGICLDTSHAHMACEYLKVDFNEYVKQLKPYVQHLHISDAKGIEGEGTQIGSGDIDFKRFFEIYKDYSGTWIPEIWQGHQNDHYEAKIALKKIGQFTS